MSFYTNRSEAGGRLAEELSNYKDKPDTIVLGLPRGGVPVAYEVARNLNLPLDIYLVRKMGVPGQEELAFGAVAENGAVVLNQDVVKSFDISDDMIDNIKNEQSKTLEKRKKHYRGDNELPDLKGKNLILVDDGLATGASMKVAIQSLREEEPNSVISAVPVGAKETVGEVEKIADEVVAAVVPIVFFGVGSWYYDFKQTSDDEVKYYLESARKEIHSQ